MYDPLMWFRDGGVFMYVILLLGGLSLALAIGLVVLPILRLRVPAPAWLLGPMLTGAVGLLGTVVGLRMAQEAVLYASAELQGTLMAAGLGIALITTFFGWFVAVIPLALGTLGLGVGLVVRPGIGARLTLVHAVGPALVGLVGAVGVAAFSLPAGALVLVVSLGLVLASLRFPDAQHERFEARDARRVATGRLAVGALGAVGALALSVALRVTGISTAFQAVAQAPAEMRSELVAQGLSEASQGGWAAVVAAVVLILAGALAAAPVSRWLVDARALVGAVVFVLLGGLPLVSQLLVAHQVSQAEEHTRPWWEGRVQELEALGITVPQAEQGAFLFEHQVLTAGPGGLELDGQTIPWGAQVREGVIWPLFEALDGRAVRAADLAARTGMIDFDGGLLLEADAELSWIKLEPVLRTAGAARWMRLEVVVWDGTALEALEVGLVADAHPKAGTTPAWEPPEEPDPEMVEMPDRFVEWVIEEEDQGPQIDLTLRAVPGGWSLVDEEGLPGPADTPEVVAGLLMSWPEVDRVLVRPAPTTTLQEVVTLTETLAVAVPEVALDLRPELETVEAEVEVQ